MQSPLHPCAEGGQTRRRTKGAQVRARRARRRASPCARRCRGCCACRCRARCGGCGSGGGSSTRGGATCCRCPPSRPRSGIKSSVWMALMCNTRLQCAAGACLANVLKVVRPSKTSYERRLTFRNVSLQNIPCEPSEHALLAFRLYGRFTLGDLFQDAAMVPGFARCSLSESTLLLTIRLYPESLDSLQRLCVSGISLLLPRGDHCHLKAFACLQGYLAHKKHPSP
jgi:hypothetical protein